MHPALKIKIPRAVAGDANSDRARAYWDLVRAHGKSRKSMVDFICGIGGYSNHDITSAIEFNVKLYSLDLSVEYLWGMLTSGDMDVGPDSTYSPEDMTRAKNLFCRVHKQHEDSLWEWGVEEAYEGWKDSDTPYETFAGERVDWKFGLYGRSGGHLCMKECEGHDLRVSNHDLNVDLATFGSDQVWSHADVRKLFIICVQNTVDLTHQKIGAEIEYRAAWRLWVSFCEEELNTETAEIESREEIKDGVAHILRILKADTSDTGGDSPLETFRIICHMANVKIEG